MKKIVWVLIFCVFFTFLEARPKIGLVLSGGGAKGFAHIGMLRVIEETGLPIDCIVGTSMGAIIGGFYAMGYSADEIEQIVLSTPWDDLLNDQVPRVNYYVGQKRWAPTGNFNFNLDKNCMPSLPQGFIIGNNIHLNLIKYAWKANYSCDFDSLKIPFRCVGTSLLTGKPILFSKGSLANAMRASSSLPSIFLPFEIDQDLVIDGGISQNFPVDVAKELGMDIIIGLKTNSVLQTKEELVNIVNVLNQTINIGMTSNLEKSSEKVDILISPAVDEFSVIDFNKAKEIIMIGELEASRYFPVFDSLANYISTFNDSIKIKENYCMALPDTLAFKWIYVENNEYLHSSKIREYVGLQSNVMYSKDQILSAFYQAWTSELFDQIYPVINKDNNDYSLTIHVKEKERKHLGINLTYNEYNGFIAGSILDFNNVIQKNSRFLVNAQIGGKYELDLDYVKNFGKHFGAYFRLFPYVKEDKILIYNDKHEKTMSLKYSEYGGTAGVGIYAFNNSILESFIYHFHKNQYKDIATIDYLDNKMTSVGYGLKFYYEEANDIIFMQKGRRLLAKFLVSEQNRYSNKYFKKMIIKDYFAIPFSQRISWIGHFEYGTYFETEPVQVDLFNVGGINNFMGVNTQEVYTPFYRMAKVGFRVNLKKNIFTDLTFNYLTWGNQDKWMEMNNTLTALGLNFGYKTIFGPVRIAFSYNENNKFFSYVSVGYDYDAFEFSRR